MYSFSPTLEFAQHLDQGDPLRDFRNRFHVGDAELIYLDGNSLGRLPKSSSERVQQVVDQEWGNRLIRSWNEGWLELPQRVGDKLGQLLGAQPGEVLVSDSTSVNLYKLLVAALQYQKNRTVILTDDLNFPSDVYIMEGAIQALGRQHTLKIVPSSDGIHGPIEQLVEAMTEKVAVLSLSHTVFKSGYTYPLKKITLLAKEKGILLLWDFSHSVGSVPIHLQGAGVDLAVGCTYKYLNGGPGAPAFLYVSKSLQPQLHNPISGWMGQRNMFEFAYSYQPADGVLRFLAGTPSVIATSLVEMGVELVLEAGMSAIREKSMQASEYMKYLWEEWLKPYGVSFNSPWEVKNRGSHISIGHDAALAIDQILIQEMQVLPDFRAPDNIRLGIAPLYTTYPEIYEAMKKIRHILEHKLYENNNLKSPTVT